MTVPWEDGSIRIALPLTLVVFALLVLLHIVSVPLLPIDETRYLDVAWEMHLTGDLAHLTRNFDLYTHKPPLLFWLINLVWLGTGVNEFAARLVAPAFALVAVGVTGALARMFWPIDRGVGGRAALAMAGFSVFAIYGSATMFDSMLTVAVLGGIWALWRIGLGADRMIDWALFGLFLALGTYAKGPVILVHLAVPFLTLRFWAPNPPSGDDGERRAFVAGGRVGAGRPLAGPGRYRRNARLPGRASLDPVRRAGRWRDGA
ncbi:MAG: glycosyltransferase family 39 protein [Defluviimonas denitrificans]